MNRRRLVECAAAVLIVSSAWGCRRSAPAAPVAEDPWDLVKAHVTLAQAVGPGAADRHDRSLARLRTQSAAVTGAIVAHFDETAASAPATRRSLVFLLGEIGDARAVTLLRRVLETAPKDVRPAHHAVLGDDVLLRKRCVSSLGALARREIPGARDALVAALGHPAREARLAAARALTDLGGGDAALASLVRARLPRDEWFAIDGSQRRVVHLADVEPTAHAHH